MFERSLGEKVKQMPDMDGPQLVSIGRGFHSITPQLLAERLAMVMPSRPHPIRCIGLL